MAMHATLRALARCSNPRAYHPTHAGTRFNKITEQTSTRWRLEVLGVGPAPAFCRKLQRGFCTITDAVDQGESVTSAVQDGLAGGDEWHEETASAPPQKTPVLLSDLPKELVDKYVHKLGSWRTTFRTPVYTLPYLEAPDEEIATMDKDMIRVLLKAYGERVWVPMKGYIKPKGKQSRIEKNKKLLNEQKEQWPEIWRRRLRISTQITNKQQVKRGTVVSNKMDRTVNVAVRVVKYVPKFNKHYFKHHKFFAHDEYNLCREGDEVAIKQLKTGNLTERKNWVIIENYGSRVLKKDPRKELLLAYIEQRLLIERLERETKRKIRPYPKISRQEQLKAELDAAVAMRDLSITIPPIPGQESADSQSQDSGSI
ncbi:30S ribosomal protein S17 [Porphyridium purpureum]|uniref:30S ribosomal protein S17 n=1 Tax=Porphyridium purpureum TaxID=35688 RepID=A0A5J4Z5E7_PORPP|nr:30S ribosomal protein S17 [Porphyridium purpureum]|eukprot:POR0957..scf295_1